VQQSPLSVPGRFKALRRICVLVPCGRTKTGFLIWGRAVIPSPKQSLPSRINVSFSDHSKESIASSESQNKSKSLYQDFEGDNVRAQFQGETHIAEPFSIGQLTFSHFRDPGCETVSNSLIPTSETTTTNLHKGTYSIALSFLSRSSRGFQAC